MSNTLGFVGAKIDRADHLRGDTKALELGLSHAKAHVFWRARPLVSADHSQLIALPLDHPIFADGDLQIFLGRVGAQHIYAIDISNWEPEIAPEPSGNPLFDRSEISHPDAPDGAVFTDARFAMGALQSDFAEWAASAKAMFHWHRGNGFCAKCGNKTDIVKAGWERVCDACGTHHYPRVDPSVIMLVTYGNKALLGRSPGWPEKMYSCLAGFMEPGETIEMAVAREVKEEAGVEIGQVKYLLSQPWPYPSSLMIGCVAEAKKDFLNIDENELEDAIWISKEELIERSSGDDPEIFPARPGAIAYELISAWLKDDINQLNDRYGQT